MEERICSKAAVRGVSIIYKYILSIYLPVSAAVARLSAVYSNFKQPKHLNKMSTVGIEIYAILKPETSPKPDTLPLSSGPLEYVCFQEFPEDRDEEANLVSNGRLFREIKCCH